MIHPACRHLGGGLRAAAAGQAAGLVEEGAERPGAVPVEPASPAARPHPRRGLRHRPQPRDARRLDRVGVDHNAAAVQVARERGLNALTVDGVGAQRPAPARALRRHPAGSRDRAHGRRGGRALCASTCRTCGRAARCSSSARRSAATPATRPTSASRPATTWSSWRAQVGLRARPVVQLPVPAVGREAVHLQRVLRAGEQTLVRRSDSPPAPTVLRGHPRPRTGRAADVRRRAARPSRCRSARHGALSSPGTSSLSWRCISAADAACSLASSTLHWIGAHPEGGERSGAVARSPWSSTRQYVAWSIR